jgi:hypothetical protein
VRKAKWRSGRSIFRNRGRSRALLFFLYRYFLRLGFLDGWQGFAFHFLQGFWYRFLVDVKVHELETLMRNGGVSAFGRPTNKGDVTL